MEYDVSNFPTICLFVFSNSIEAKRMQIDEANADVPRLKEEIIEDERVLSELRGRRGAVREALDSMKTIKTRMAMAERKIAELQVDVKSVEEIMDDKDRSIEVSIFFFFYFEFFNGLN